MCAPETARRRGFTLAELIIVVVCIGILGGLAAGGFRNLMQVAREEAAMGKARILNAARYSYGLTVADAETRWDACGTDEERVALLKAARLLEGEAPDYLYSQGGYTLALGGSLRGRTLVSKDGEAFSYR